MELSQKIWNEPQNKIWKDLLQQKIFKELGAKKCLLNSISSKIKLFLTTNLVQPQIDQGK